MSNYANTSNRRSTQEDRTDWGRSDWSNLADAYRDGYAGGSAPDLDELTRQINALPDGTKRAGGAR